MVESESSIEDRLIEQLTLGDSQWTFRPDINDQKSLHENFRRILENNNKARLSGTKLSDQEFEQVLNQLSFPTFYDAAVWLAGENGNAEVHVQRGNETLHLVVLNRYEVAGGHSVYEVIHQYESLKDLTVRGNDRNRRFDVTLLINGLPLIHIELKNFDHSYMKAFNQIKKYIGEGKFHGLFSCVQMFIVSNAADTRYIAPTDADRLNETFLCQWTDKDNNPVADIIQFASAVLSIPQAHYMVTQYTVLDAKARSIKLLRPYQIHAINAMKKASKSGISGFIWHTTGSGKTMTSYKSARNLLYDIPSIEKTIFLIDRKALDAQTCRDFTSYAQNDCVDVDNTDNVEDLRLKLLTNEKQMIVTTIQKLQHLMKRLSRHENSSYWKKIHSRKIAFVVDECHRTVTPETKAQLASFFENSLWYGFTGTPIFAPNAYQAKGELPRTTEQLFGPALHKYTIKHAIHDRNVLGFQTEFYGETVSGNVSNSDKIYHNDKHRLNVLKVILTQCAAKFGVSNGPGNTYEAILTCDSIPEAQKYYSLLKNIKAGKIPDVKVGNDYSKIKDFPKFAITYSVSENENRSVVDQAQMKEALADYNSMFGTSFDMDQIEAYNIELGERLARKSSLYRTRDKQLDLVIVVDRLLTGFDAPCLSTVFVDRNVMSPHAIIQMFSRTNRLLDSRKEYGQIVTFRNPEEWDEKVKKAIILFSDGDDTVALSPGWEETEADFRKALDELRKAAPQPQSVPGFSKKEKRHFAWAFQKFDRALSSIVNFTRWKDHSLEEYGISEDEIDNYRAQYLNVIDEIVDPDPGPGGGGEDGDGERENEPDPEYVLKFSNGFTVDYEFIVALMQGCVSDMTGQLDLLRINEISKEISGYLDEFSKRNPKLGSIMRSVWEQIQNEPAKFKNQQIGAVIEEMKQSVINRFVDQLCDEWFIDRDLLLYVINSCKSVEKLDDDMLQDLEDSGDFGRYKEVNGQTRKLDYLCDMEQALRSCISEEIIPLTVTN